MTQAGVLIQGKRLHPSDSAEYIASGAMSFDEFLAWEYEGGLTEWVNGEVFVYMSANYEHQRIQRFLTVLLAAWCDFEDAGEILTAPYAIQPEAGGAGREPDLVFVSREHSTRIGPKHLAGTPDLVVEIVSPESAARDRVTKLREYERAGIPEYWIVDSRPGIERADFFGLDAEGHYEPVPVRDGTVRSKVLGGFWLRVAWLWDPEQKPLVALREVRGGSLD